MNDDWWRDAAVYQLYLRSFADADGDGVGDLRGLRERFGHLVDLGIDAIWLNPCYVSPQRDHGYDIADYFRPDPVYGSLEDLRALITEAHEHGIRVLMDMVANHCSDEHDWFRAALAAEPGSPERARFLFREGRGESGELPPNNWQSVFGGPAWTRVAAPDGPPGQWYFHAFDSSQPDFDWRNPEVAEYFDDVLRHWFDLGVDGFRIDVAHGMVKDAGLPDWPGADTGTGGHNYAMWDQPEIHAIYRRWRAIGEEYTPPRYFVGEIWVPDPSALVTYLAPDELHQTFAFDLLVQPWDAQRLRAAVERGLRDSARAGSIPAWTLSNHDVHRPVTRYGQEQELGEPDPTDMIAAARRRGPVDVDLGRRRARSALLLQLALPGANYLYQGEELGLPEVLDLPSDARQDPIWHRSAGSEPGRDGCRVPLPWTETGTSMGFGPDGAAAPWLPQPEWFSGFAVENQGPGSALALYREALHRRREVFDADAPLRWIDAGHPALLAFQRGRGVCVVNVGDTAVALPRSWAARQLLASDDVAPDGIVPPDRAVWLVTDRDLAADEPADGVRQDSPTLQPQPTAS